MISIKPLTAIPIKTIYNAFTNAFSDYVEPFNATIEQFKYLIERRGCNVELSFGAFYEDQLIGFILNGFGVWNNVQTAYDTGTGIIKDFRKKGIATQIFNESLPVLRENTASQYLLEVIKTNVSAFKLYQKAGFKVVREFNYYISSKEYIKFTENKLNKTCSIKEIEDPEWELFNSFWDFYPSWQNSIDSIKRKRTHFTILGIWDDGKLAGYGIIENDSGDIPQIAIKKSFRRRGLATTLLKSLLAHSNVDRISIINTDAECEAFNEFAKSLNLAPGQGQYEMLLEL